MANEIFYYIHNKFCENLIDYHKQILKKCRQTEEKNFLSEENKIFETTLQDFSVRIQHPEKISYIPFLHFIFSPLSSLLNSALEDNQKIDTFFGTFTMFYRIFESSPQISGQFTESAFKDIEVALGQPNIIKKIKHIVSELEISPEKTNEILLKNFPFANLHYVYGLSKQINTLTNMDHALIFRLKQERRKIFIDLILNQKDNENEHKKILSEFFFEMEKENTSFFQENLYYKQQLSFCKSIANSIKISENYKKIFTSNTKKQLFFFNMDFKQLSIAKALLLDSEISQQVYNINKDTYIVLKETDTNTITDYYLNFQCKYFIIIDNHDESYDQVFLSEKTLKTVKKHNLEIVYIRLQPYNRYFYRNFLKKNKLENVIFLSAPLLLGGSDKHVTLGKDYKGDYLFEKNLSFETNPEYVRDWMFIGSMTSEDRREAVNILKNFNKRYKGFLTVSDPDFPSAKVATVPIDEYLNMIKRTKVNISLNGNGIWTLKDGECFCRGCFVLRQYHKFIDINRLSPVDGKHWIVFKNNELTEKLIYYIENDKERETIRENGYLYLKNMINRGFAREYIRGITDFFEHNNGDSEKLAGLML